MKFQATPIRCIYNTEDFKVYACDIDAVKYPDIKINSYGNVTISGSCPELTLDSIYDVDGIEEKGKYGYGYKIKYIKQKRPMTENGLKQFLLGCGLSDAQTSEVIREYPNIISLVENNKTDEIDISKLHNIGEYRIGVIVRKIEENFMLADIVEQLGGYFDFNTIKKLYDKYHSTEEIIEAITTQPYESLCQIDRIGFKTADKKLILLERKIKENIKNGIEVPFEFIDDLQTSKDRCVSALIYLLEENELNGNTIMDIKTAKTELNKLVPECSHHFIDVCKTMSSGDEPKFHIDKITSSISNYQTYFIEQKCGEIIANVVNNKQNIWDIDVEKYRTNEDITLTDEQLKTLSMVCENDISVLQGFAGSGKSASTLALIKMLQDNHKSFSLCSPTGRASKVMSGYTKQPASTIHRLLGLGSDFPCEIYTDIVIVDETSMCDLRLFYALLSAIDFKRTKLLMIGDSAQLPSVGAGNVLFDIINSNKVKVNSLSKIFRYGTGGILTVATDIRECNTYLQYNEEKKIFGDDNGYIFMTTPQEMIIKKVSTLYQQLLNKGYSKNDILILSAYNKGSYGTTQINNILQPIANLNYGVGECFELKTNKKDDVGVKFYEEDIVIETQNNYRAMLCNDDFEIEYDKMFKPKTTFIPNGEIGTIKKIENKKVYIQFDKLVCYPYENMKSVKLAYSISVHKSQGGSAKIIILLTPKAHQYMLNSNLLYVGVTRASEKVIHFGEPKTVNLSVKKKADTTRYTNLIHFITNNKETI
jgi:exodeoxyribonuclease V alpha subunit